MFYLFSYLVYYLCFNNTLIFLICQYLFYKKIYFLLIHSLSGLACYAASYIIIIKGGRNE